MTPTMLSPQDRGFAMGACVVSTPRAEGIGRRQTVRTVRNRFPLNPTVGTFTAQAASRSGRHPSPTGPTGGRECGTAGAASAQWRLAGPLPRPEVPLTSVTPRNTTNRAARVPAALLALALGVGGPAAAVAGHEGMGMAAQAAVEGARLVLAGPAEGNGRERIRQLRSCAPRTAPGASAAEIAAFAHDVERAEDGHIGALWTSKAKLADMPTPLLVRAFKAWNAAARMQPSETFLLPQGLKDDRFEIGKALLAILEAANRSPEDLAEIIGQVNLVGPLSVMTNQMRDRVYAHIRTAVGAFHNDPHRAACVLQRVVGLNFSLANVEFAVGPEESAKLGRRAFAPSNPSRSEIGRIQLSVYDFSPGTPEPDLSDPAWSLALLFADLSRKGGVPIEVVLDKNGTLGVLDSAKKARAEAMIGLLQDAGVRVTLRSALKVGSGNHAKLALIEECTRLPDGGRVRAFKLMTGSENIGPNYQSFVPTAQDQSDRPAAQQQWLDLTALFSNLSPEVIRQVQATLDEYRIEAGGPAEARPSLCAEAPMAPHRPEPGAVPILPIEHAPDDALQKLALLLILSSSPEALIASPYATDADYMERILPELARAGKKIMFITPGDNNDQPLVQAAARSFYPGFLSAGVEIHEWIKSMAHLKLVLAQPQASSSAAGLPKGGFTVVGSLNLDAVSTGGAGRKAPLHDNREFAIVVQDPILPGALKEGVLSAQQHERITTYSPSALDRLMRIFAGHL
ncbi:MAG: hypothetical protein IPK13_00845 [Deltaproteobacteria bacterium]|nr:hypothetical protein [Deltaproteobacteria bacterium]